MFSNTFKSKIVVILIALHLYAYIPPWEAHAQERIKSQLVKVNQGLKEGNKLELLEIFLNQEIVRRKLICLGIDKNDIQIKISKLDKSELMYLAQNSELLNFGGEVDTWDAIEAVLYLGALIFLVWALLTLRSVRENND